jgi:hypothetical protein
LKTKHVTTYSPHAPTPKRFGGLCSVSWTASAISIRRCEESDASLREGGGWIRQLKTLTYGFTKFTQR